MKRFSRTLTRNQKGFTLIELLVVVAILGILAAVAVPNVSKFMNKGETEAASAELHNVMTAMMAMMADLRVDNVTAVDNATNDMTSFPDTTNPLYGGIGARYISVPDTTWTYTTSSDGTISQGPKP